MHRQELKFNLEKALNEGVEKVTYAASSVLGRKVYLVVSRPDKFRMLNLISWSERYHISLEEILSVLLKIWLKKFSNNSKGIGVRLSLLAGPKSKEIIKGYIKKTYPNNEHLTLYKEENKFYAHNDMEYDDPLTYARDYIDSIRDLRAKDAAQERMMQRRKWRDNPF